MKRLLTYILLTALPAILLSQGFNQQEGFGSGEIFNPFRNQKDTTNNDVVVPKEIHQWHIDDFLGDVEPVNADTLQYLFQNWHQTEGMKSEYNFLGNMGTPRQTRMFFDRPSDTQFHFLQPYSYFYHNPKEFFFTDTKSPYTNIGYHNAGNKVTGDDRIRIYFTTNAGKHFGIGFLFDYLYGRGRYDSQTTAFMNISLFSYYRSDRYNYHLLASRHHTKMIENGGITNDEYITNPENTDISGSQFGTTDIPVLFNKTWNRNERYNVLFTHNYNFGFYREVAKNLSEDSLRNEITKLITERNNNSSDSTLLPDSTLIAELSDSLMQSEEQNVEYEERFIRVARIIHTADFKSADRDFICYSEPRNYYADRFLKYDSIDATRNLGIRNTIAISLSEGFSKWAFANITAYATHDYNRYTLPDTTTANIEYRKIYNEHSVKVGGIIESKRSKYINYKVRGETSIAGNDLGAFLVDGHIKSNFKLLKQDFEVTAKAFIKNNYPSFYYRHYHSEHYWWDNDDISKEFRTRIDGTLAVKNWRTRINIAFENIKNYTYIANLSAPNIGNLGRLKAEQVRGNIQVFSASLKQSLKFGIFNLDAEATYQKSSNSAVLPLPALDVYGNIYLKFRIAKVLYSEIGADARYFTPYYAPDYSAALGQFCQQNQEDKVEIGNYPIVSVYANFMLKQTRFYVKYYHLNQGTGNRKSFLVPHYPISPATLWLGLSWNFYN